MVFEKINISKVFKKHINTLKINGSDSYSIEDLLLFLLFPAILAIALIYLKINLTPNVIVILVTSLSIFAALLFNLLLLIYDIVTKLKENESKTENDVDTIEQVKKNGSLKEKLIEETYINISYNITIAIITIILLLILYFILDTIVTPYCGNSTIMRNSTTMQSSESLIYVILFCSFFIYYFLTQFMLTLFMILKRINVLVSKEFKELGKKNNKNTKS